MGGEPWWCAPDTSFAAARSCRPSSRAPGPSSPASSAYSQPAPPLPTYAEPLQEAIPRAHDFGYGVGRGGRGGGGGGYNNFGSVVGGRGGGYEVGTEQSLHGARGPAPLHESSVWSGARGLHRDQTNFETASRQPPALGRSLAPPFQGTSSDAYSQRHWGPSPSNTMPPAGSGERLAPSITRSTEGPMAELSASEARLETLAVSIGASLDAFQAGRSTPGQARDALAQLEAQVDCLQCEGIDSVSIADLPATEQDAARALRRALTRRLEALQARLDASFEWIGKSSKM